MGPKKGTKKSAFEHAVEANDSNKSNTLAGMNTKNIEALLAKLNAQQEAFDLTEIVERLDQILAKLDKTPHTENENTSSGEVSCLSIPWNIMYRLNIREDDPDPIDHLLKMHVQLEMLKKAENCIVPKNTTKKRIEEGSKTTSCNCKHRCDEPLVPSELLERERNRSAKLEKELEKLQRKVDALENELERQKRVDSMKKLEDDHKENVYKAKLQRKMDQKLKEMEKNIRVKITREVDKKAEEEMETQINATVKQKEKEQKDEEHYVNKKAMKQSQDRPDIFDESETKNASDTTIENAQKSQQQQSMIEKVENGPFRFIKAITKIHTNDRNDDDDNLLIAIQPLMHSFFWQGNARQVSIKGTWDCWQHSKKLERIDNDLFTCRIQLSPGSYEYKFLVDGDWKIDPNQNVKKTSCDKFNWIPIGFGGWNQDEICLRCPNFTQNSMFEAGLNEGRQVKIDIQFLWPYNGNSVFVMGSWDNWQELWPLKKSLAADIAFTVKLKLLPGVYEYIFWVDGKLEINKSEEITSDKLLNVLTVSDETSNSNHEQSAMPISSMTSSEKSYSSAIVAPVKNGVTFTPIEQEVLQNSSTSADNYSTSDNGWWAEYRRSIATKFKNLTAQEQIVVIKLLDDDVKQLHIELKQFGSNFVLHAQLKEYWVLRSDFLFDTNCWESFESLVEQGEALTLFLQLIHYVRMLCLILLKNEGRGALENGTSKKIFNIFIRQTDKKFQSPYLLSFEVFELFMEITENIKFDILYHLETNEITKLKKEAKSIATKYLNQFSF